MFRTWIGLSCIWLVSCQSTVSKDYWERSLAAGKSGVPRDPTLFHTVALVDPDPDVGQFCSGVVIDKRHIVTAASCLSDSQRIPYVLMEKPFQVGLDYSDRISMVRVELAVIHARYQKPKSDAYVGQVLASKEPKLIPSPGGPLHDIAVAVLESDVIVPYQPIRLAGPQDDLKKAKLEAAAYGCADKECDAEEAELRKTNLTWVKPLPDANLAISLRGSRSTSCAGDAGGPAYRVDAKGISLVAIQSAHSNICEAGLSVDTLVAPYRAWIEQGMKVLARPMLEADGYRVIDFTQAEADQG